MITEIKWTPEIERELDHPAIGDSLAYLRAEVSCGLAQLWHCRDDEHEAYMITRLDHNPTEWVVCYFVGTGLQKFGREVVRAATKKGLRLRAHTVRPGVARMLERLGLVNREFVLRS